MADDAILYRRAPRWRRRSVFAAAGLRAPLAEHSRSEGELLHRHASGAACIVELGVAEGGSAFELRRAMHADGTLFLVDPYPPGRLGFNLARSVARRLVGRVANGEVVWIAKASQEAGRGWTRPIDFLFVDADHSFQAVLEDWTRWSPHVRIGGRVALHDARVCDWIAPDDGPVRLLARLRHQPAWRTLEAADSTVVLERVG